MGNRKLPFGYQRCFGDIVPHAAEAEAVRKIYQNYLAGASFRQIAEGLQAQGIPYDGDKQWNKNMVARILENERYTGIGAVPSSAGPPNTDRTRENADTGREGAAKALRRRTARVCGTTGVGHSEPADP